LSNASNQCAQDFVNAVCANAFCSSSRALTFCICDAYPLQACGRGWNFLRFLRNRRFLLRYFAMRPQNTRSANLQTRCLVNFRLLCQRNSPDFSENENHVLGRIAL